MTGDGDDLLICESRRGKGFRQRAPMGACAIAVLLLVSGCGGGGGGGGSEPAPSAPEVQDTTPPAPPEPAGTLVVLDQGLAGDSWDLGFNAYDEGIDFGLCTRDKGAGCPNIGWQVVQDEDRGAVLEISHSAAGLAAGFFIKTSNPIDMRSFAGGWIRFDVRIMGGDSRLSMKIDCVYPCTSGDHELGAVSGGDWVAMEVAVDDLVAGSLDLTTIDTGIVIWATGFTDTVFRLDRVRWVPDPDAVIPDIPEPGSDWSNPGLTGPDSPLSYDGYRRLWSDEFDASSLDTTDWNYEIGNGDNGWGNNELQYYRAENSYLADGLLVIEARRENFGGRAYTSARLTTEGKFSFRYGRVDIRAAMPAGQGLWPALWMLGANFSRVGWPASGEIDIMEMIGGGGRESVVHGTAHWRHEGTHASHSGSHRLSGDATLANGFHVYSILWTDSQIRWYIDDRQYHVMNINSTGGLAAFQKEFFLIVNLAVGGDWPGPPSNTTRFPQRLLVDYIRVFQKE